MASEESSGGNSISQLANESTLSQRRNLAHNGASEATSSRSRNETGLAASTVSSAPGISNLLGNGTAAFLTPRMPPAARIYQSVPAETVAATSSTHFSAEAQVHQQSEYFIFPPGSLDASDPLGPASDSVVSEQVLKETSVPEPISMMIPKKGAAFSELSPSSRRLGEQRPNVSGDDWLQKIEKIRESHRKREDRLLGSIDNRLKQKEERSREEAKRKQYEEEMETKRKRYEEEMETKRKRYEYHAMAASEGLSNTNFANSIEASNPIFIEHSKSSDPASWELPSSISNSGGFGNNAQPYKCIFQDCEYGQKGFARAYDWDRHSLAHYRKEFKCPFCGSGDEGRPFSRIDRFKRHWRDVHGVDIPLSTRSLVPRPRESEFLAQGQGASSNIATFSGVCPNCNVTGINVRNFWDHFGKCVLEGLRKQASSEQQDREEKTAKASGCLGSGALRLSICDGQQTRHIFLRFVDIFMLMPSSYQHYTQTCIRSSHISPRAICG